MASGPGLSSSVVPSVPPSPILPIVLPTPCPVFADGSAADLSGG